MSVVPKLKCEVCQGLGCIARSTVGDMPPGKFKKCQKCRGTGIVGGKPDPKDGGLGTELEIRQFEP